MIPKSIEDKETNIVLNGVDTFLESNYSDGDIVSLHWLKNTLKIDEPKTMEEVKGFQWELLNKVEMFKEELLLNHSIALRNVRGNGYMIVPPYQQAEYAADVGIKAMNKGMKKAERLLENTRTEILDDPDKKRHIDAQVKFSAMKGILNKQKINVFALFREPKKVGNK